MPTRVEQTSTMEAGRARLIASPAPAVDPATLEVAFVRIDRGSPHHLDPTLPEDQAWVAGERWFAPDAARLDQGSLVFEVGPAVTWRLKPFMPYLLQLKDGRGGRFEERLSWGRIRLPSTPPPPQASTEPRAAEPAGAPAEDPLDHFDRLAREAPVVAPPVSAPEPAVAAPAKTGRQRQLALAAVALLMLAGGAGWAAYTYLNEPAMVPPPSAPEIAMTVDGARGYILNVKPSGADAGAMAQRFAAAGAVEGAFLLRQHAARNGDAASAAELARLYDPEFFAAGSSPVGSASLERAIDWYQRAAEAGDVASMRRLAALLKDPAANLQDGVERATFWERRAEEAGGAAAAGGAPEARP